MDWKPISTAPTDGTVVLVWGTLGCTGPMVFPASCDDFEDEGNWHCIDWSIEATHWCEMPEGPTISEDT